MYRPRIFRQFDFFLFGIALSLSIIGLLFIYSSQIKLEPTVPLYAKQLFFVLIGIILYFIFSKINYHIYSAHAIQFYCLGIALLMIVLLFGTRIHGAKSWISLGFINLQLSEIVKIIYIINFTSLSIFFRENIYTGIFFFISITMLAPYLVLIALQPDFGTMCVFLTIFLGMFFLVGGNIQIIILLFPIAALSIGIPFIGFTLHNYIDHQKYPILSSFFYSTSHYLFFILISCFFILFSFFLKYLSNKRIFWNLTIIFFIIFSGFIGALVVKSVLKDYHFQRILTVINPSLDPEGQGYNVNQSLIAIGSGGFSGSGLGKGSQNIGNFLPAKHTDFILSLLAQEWGFLGVLLVLLLNLLLISTVFQTAREANDFMAFVVACGIGVLYLAHFIINVFSIIGFFPVIGIPLPFISYGGSSIVTNFIALGIVSNIRKSS